MLKNIAQKILFMRLSKLKIGLLTIQDGQESWTFGDPRVPSELNAVIRVISPNFYWNSLFGGSLGAADSFIQKGWETEDLTTLLRLFLRNEITRNYQERSRFKLGNWWRWVIHQFKRNNMKGSRRNIAKHYDLSNQFFGLFLDKNMM